MNSTPANYPTTTNSTGRTTRRLVIAATFAAALAVGWAGSGPADAAVRTSPEQITRQVPTAPFQAPAPSTTAPVKLAAARTIVLDDFSPAGPGAIDDYKAGPGCSIQCITSGVAHAAGSGAELVVTTDTPAKIYIHVWDDDGYFRQAVSEFGQVEFSHLFDDLEPNHSYHAMAAAEDGDGYTSHGFGHFTTLG